MPIIANLGVMQWWSAAEQNRSDCVSPDSELAAVSFQVTVKAVLNHAGVG